MSRLNPLRAQVLVITGASSGIGLATARLAAARGARVVLVARSANALRQLEREIRAASGTALAVPADVSSEEDVARIAGKAVEAFGGFDTWINNAGVSAYGACTDVTPAEMRRIMETNFWGVVYGSRVACAHLRRRGGALINLGSILSDGAVPLQGIYTASKHAIKGWTDALRMELQYEGAPISVTLIKPASIGTPYAEHASNYLPDQPTHVPPVYTPRSVARAILHAAEHPAREIVVGGAGRALEIGWMVAPPLVDGLMARFMIPATHSGREKSGRPALFSPSEDLRERGDYPGIVRPSLYTAVRLRPVMAALGGIGVALLLTFPAASRAGRGPRARPSCSKPGR
jgi:short-subunit dehydrogenase